MNTYYYVVLLISVEIIFIQKSVFDIFYDRHDRQTNILLLKIVFIKQTKCKIFY